MASIIRGLDTLQTGENNHMEYKYSAELRELIVQVFFNAVRSSELNKLSTVLNHPEFKENTFEYDIMVRMALNTRDIKNGKGEYKLGYIFIREWYKINPNIARMLIQRYVTEFGSWKDIKYLCNFLGREHSLVNYCVNLISNQLKKDDEDFKNKKNISLAGKWAPREKSKQFGWIAHLISKEMELNPQSYRTLVARLNNYIDTTQIKMCNNTWDQIDFGKVTSLTLNKFKKSFLNSKNKESDVRIKCADNLKNHLNKCVEGTAKINSKTLNVYEMVKTAYVNNNNDNDIINLVNAQWNEHSKQTGNLCNIIPMADTSGSMTCNNCEPLYSALGLSIRVSEKTHPAFRNRVLTFSASPNWVILDEKLTFHEKVKLLSRANWGMNTNFYTALELILNIIRVNKISPEEIGTVTLAIFSDMQIDYADKYYISMYDGIASKFKEIGHEPPHIIFWNLAGRTTGFPTLSTTKNCSMLSGYNSSLLNLFCEKGSEILKDLSPWKLMCEALLHERYSY